MGQNLRGASGGSWHKMGGTYLNVCFGIWRGTWGPAESLRTWDQFRSPLGLELCDPFKLSHICIRESVYTANGRIQKIPHLEIFVIQIRLIFSFMACSKGDWEFQCIFRRQ